MLRCRRAIFVCFGLCAALVSSAIGDETFNKLINDKKFDDAIRYADDKIPMGDRTADVWVKIALANEEIGLTEKALACYMVSSRMNPNDYSSLLGAARIYNKLDQADNALNMAKKALDQNFTGEASWEYARACIKLNRSAEAKSALEKVIESDPNNIVANRELGIIYHTDKVYDKAIPLLTKALADKPDADISFKLAKCYYETNNLPAAIAALRDATKAKPDLWDAGYLLAKVLFDSQKYKEAADEFARVSKGMSLSAADLYKWAFSVESDASLAKALDIYKMAIDKFGSSKAKEAVTARQKVGRAALEKKDFQSAITQLEFLYNVDGIHAIVPDIHFMMADAYEGLKNATKAIEILEKKIAADANSIEAYARVADMYAKNGMPDKAKSAYEKLITLRPDDPQVFMILGDFNFKAKKYDVALGHYQKSYTLKNDAKSAQGIALCAAALSKWDIAQDAAESAIKFDSDLIDSRIVLSDCYMRSKNFPEAKKQLEYITGKRPAELDFWKKLATCYESTGDIEKLADSDKRIVGMDKKDAVSRLRFALYSQSKKDSKTAYELYKDLSLLTPQDSRVFKNLYEIALASNDKPSTADYLKKYLALVNSDANAFKLLGDVSFELKNNDAALDAYDNALRIDPTIKGFFKTYTDLVIAKGQQDKIIKVSLAAIKSGEADARTYITLGMVYQKTKQFKPALEMYQKGLQLDPQNSDALIALAECQNSTGDINGSIISYEQAIMMNQNIAPKEIKTLAELYIKLKRQDQAMSAYKKYLDKVPTDEAVALDVGRYSNDKKQYDDAVKYLGMIKGEYASSVTYLTTMGNAYFALNQYPKAIAMYEEVRKKATKPATLADFIRQLAESYEKTSNDLKAGECYGLFAEAGINNPDAAYKAAFLREKSNPAVAVAIYEKNTTLYPKDYRSSLRLGLYYAMDKTNYDKSIIMFKKTAALADTIPDVWVNLAQLYKKTGKEQDEMQAWKKLLSFQPQNLDANSRLGMILMKNNQVGEGMVYLEMANTLSGKDPDVMFMLAKGYVKTKRSQEAIGLLTKAKALKPDNVEIQILLYDVYKNTDQPKKALDEIKEIVAKTHDNTFLIKMASDLFADGKLKEAEDAVEDIKSTDPANLDALMLQANIQRAKKKYDEAIDTYKEISTNNPNYVPAIYERAEVYMLQSKVKWAETFYERAMRVDPKFALGELGLAKAARMMGDKAKYAAHLEKARKLDPENKQIKDEVSKGGK